MQLFSMCLPPTLKADFWLFLKTKQNQPIILGENECKSNYSGFNLLGFDKHLLMQVSATIFFLFQYFQPDGML